jgi:pimeloyl-ACP methyl ester carboxylesterase
MTIEHATSADGTKIAYERVGRGRPVIAIHGGLGSRRIWRPVADLLAGEYELVLVDRRGRGDSEPGVEPHALEREVEDARAVVSAVGPGVTLVGHSYGGAVALELARIAAPGEIDRLVIYEPASGVGDLVSRERVRRIEALLRRGAPEEALREGLRALAEAGLVPSGARQAGPLPPGLVALAWTIPRELRSAVGLPVSRYATIEQPTLLLVGGRSPAPHHDNAASLRQALNDASVRILDGQGHDAHTNAPELFAAELGAACG